MRKKDRRSIDNIPISRENQLIPIGESLKEYAHKEAMKTIQTNHEKYLKELQKEEK